MLPCRLIVDPPAAGAWNMAVDEALLEQTANEGIAALRFYQWNPPTLSLGYFQPIDRRREHRDSMQAAIVRRLSGGGAILHDRELTYSLCLPANHPLSRQSTTIYGLVHRTLIAELAAQGVAARMWSDVAALAADASVEPEGDHFLCFQRRSGDDLVLANSAAPVAWAKIVGSAQRRRRGAVLQHGSVLLAASPLAPQLPGIRELCGVELDPGELAEGWSSRLAATLKLSLSRTDPQAAAPGHLVAPLVEKFQSAEWTARR